MATSYFYATQTKSWRGKGWRTDNSRIYQGRYPSGGSTDMHTGVCWFNASAIKSALAGQVVDTVKLRLNRTTGGQTSEKPIYMGRNNHAATLATAPSARDSYTKIASLAVGTTTWITIPNKFAEGFRDSGDTCFVFNTTDTSDAGYAIMEGAAAADAAKPYLEITYHPAATAPTAPTKVSLSPSIFENTGDGLTMEWSGAKAGTNNAIKGYTIYNNYSADNKTWRETSWNIDTDVTTYSKTGPTSSVARGEYFRIRVVTRGQTLNSGYSVFSNTVRNNTLPTGPTSFTASPSTYSTEDVTLKWSGAVAGTSSISKYVIEYSQNVGGSEWGGWYSLTSISTSATSGSYTTSPTRTSGVFTRYRIRAVDTLGAMSADAVSNNILCSISAAGEPTSVSLSATLAEGNVTLSWSGAKGGAGNAISSFEVQYSDSADGTTWGGWSALTTVSTTASSGSISVSPPGTRGYYRRFQVRTRGDAGSGYYSGWKVSGNAVRRNTLPTAPTTFTVSPAVYNSGAITLAWSGVVAGTSAIKNYVLQVATSTDNSTWGAYSNLATVNSTATSGSYEYTPSTMAAFTRYRVCVTDALDCVSGFTVSGVIRKNNPPRPPLLYAPKNNAVTFNRRPRVLLTVSTEPDGEPQTVFLLMNGQTLNSVDDKDHFSTVGALKGGVNTIFTHDGLSPGEHQITIHTSDGGANSGTVVRSFTVAESPFEEITANVTPVKATHMLALRSAVNAVRDYYGLAAYAWVREIISGKTEIKDWGWHILELRSAVEAVIQKINSFDPKGAIPPFDWLPLGTGRPRADVMDQLQNIILNL